MAKNVAVTWVQKRQFVGSDSAKHSIVISSKDEDNNTGVKPSDLLLMGLASCSAYDVVGILEKKRLKLTGLEITVTGEQDADPPWTFRKFHLEYLVRGKGLPEKAVADAIHLSEEKYCSVAATVRGVAEITSSYRIVEEE
jgi:putative redox protein